MDEHGDSGGHGDGEELGSMSQPELEELQRKNCVFCHIASGKVPARKVYEDSECVAVLDINPANQGHALLMPKEHYTVMFQVPEELLGHVFIIAKGLSQAGLKAFQSKGTTIFAANGVAAGQRAPHFMLHIIPRTPADNVGIYIPARAFPEKEAGKLAAALAAAMGGKTQVVQTASAAADAYRPEVDSTQVGSWEGVAAEEKRSGSSSADTKKEEVKEGKKEKVVAAEILEEENPKTAVKGKSADLDSLAEFLAKGGGKGGSKGDGR